jgi:hypothetical protein
MKKLYKYILILSLAILLSSCTTNDYKVLESSGNNSGIIMEGRLRRGLFGRAGGFELKLINNSGKDMQNCIIEFNSKYSHTLTGLHSKGKGMIKSDTFLKSDTLSLPFLEDVDNMIFFNIKDENFKAEKVKLKCSDCDAEWKIE